MLCLQCKKNQATKTYEQIKNGVNQTEYYCLDCYHRLFLCQQETEGEVALSACPYCGTKAEEIKKTPLIRHCVLIGATADQIERALRDVGYAAIHRAATLDEAVNTCRTLTEPGGNVLFSPACASFDMFEDYEQRGRIFKEIVNQLK